MKTEWLQKDGLRLDLSSHQVYAYAALAVRSRQVSTSSLLRIDRAYISHNLGVKYR